TGHRGPMVGLGIESRRCYPEWVARMQREAGLDVEYRTDGILYLALDRADARLLAARARWQRRLGLRVLEVGAREARRLAGPVLPPRIVLACHFPDDHRRNNERLVVAGAGAAPRRGLTGLERPPALA